MWKRATEMGLKHGQFNYSVSLVLGRKCERLCAEGAHWLRLSSEQAFMCKMFDYTQLLRTGFGFESDEERPTRYACAWTGCA